MLRFEVSANMTRHLVRLTAILAGAVAVAASMREPPVRHHSSIVARHEAIITQALEEPVIDDLLSPLPQVRQIPGQNERSPYVATPAAVALAETAKTDPVTAANQALALPYIKGNATGWFTEPRIIDYNDPDAANDYPWAKDIPFVPTNYPQGSADSGYLALPNVTGFDLNRTIEVRDGALQPIYLTKGYEPVKIKRGILVIPGKLRDSWKYVNLARNALTVTEKLFPEYGATSDNTVILGIAWLNHLDLAVGAVETNELVFWGTQWGSGGLSHSPALERRIPSYEAIDRMTDFLFDKSEFPNLNQVVVVGHSLGGQTVARYALVKKTKAYDPNMHFWVGNPGSWAWTTDDRPYPNTNASCPTDDIMGWPYGIGGNTTKLTTYAHKAVSGDREGVLRRFLGRNVHYHLGTADNGAGDTHCMAKPQGANHLDRGANFVLSVAAAYQNLTGYTDDGGISNSRRQDATAATASAAADNSSSTTSPNASSTTIAGWPPTHTASFIVDVAHQDYPMIAANASLYNLFGRDFDVSRPWLTNLTNPGDKWKPLLKPKAFATPTHTILAYAMLFGSIGMTIFGFMIILVGFRCNLSEEDQREWEREEKVMLLKKREEKVSLLKEQQEKILMVKKRDGRKR